MFISSCNTCFDDDANVDSCMMVSYENDERSDTIMVQIDVAKEKSARMGMEART